VAGETRGGLFVKVIYISSLEMGKAVLEDLLEAGFRFDGIFTINKKTAESAKVSSYADFEDIASKYKQKLYYVKKNDFSHMEDLEKIRGLKPDLIIVNGWNRLIPPEIFKLAVFTGIPPGLFDLCGPPELAGGL
jgi:methionyl-tRNA formyltransferase